LIVATRVCGSVKPQSKTAAAAQESASRIRLHAIYPRVPATYTSIPAICMLLKAICVCLPAICTRTLAMWTCVCAICEHTEVICKRARAISRVNFSIAARSFCFWHERQSNGFPKTRIELRKVPKVPPLP